MTHDNLHLALTILPEQTWQTIYMITASCCLAVIIGLPLGVILTITSRGQLQENIILYKTLSAIVNSVRSFPFAILTIAMIPVTRWIVGTSLGTTATIVPLTLAAIPLVARLIENNLRELETEIIDAARIMGSTTWQIIYKVLIPEAMPGIVASITLTAINLVGYSAMAGLIGGGGLGQIAIQYGYHRFNITIMMITVALLIILVQLIQFIGDWIIKKLVDHRN